MLLIVSLASAGTVGIASGFEDDDANLADNSGTGINAGIDWNSFADVAWAPHPATVPTRQADKVLSGWTFKGIEDWQATTADSGFAGGTKQDDDCPTVISAKAPNKDDLKRIYISSKTGSNGHTYLNLAWVRIPQNTTSPSAHVGFEFNKGNNGGCATGGLVKRSAGDLLIVYDFEGGGTPVLTLRKWVTSGACEVSSDAAPCWGVAQNLTASGYAEAAVNTGSTALDELTPPALSSSTGTSVDSTLGLSEFGEAGIDLTDAGVFTSGTCNSFGKAYGVSRSSGSSGTAQMKDLVGPANFNLSNCGTVTIIKHTNPRGLNQSFSYSTTGGLTPSTFTLNDNGNSGTADSTGNTRTYTDVPSGSYTVTEGADPAGFSFGSLSCTASGTGTSGAQNGTVAKQADIVIAGGGSVTCTYVNNQELGAIKITKTSSKGANATLNGATFSITKGGSPISGSPFTTAGGGVICVANLAFGDYVVTETAPPTGYELDDSTGHTVTVDNNANCTDATYVGESIGFTDTPVFDIQVRFRDGGSGATSLVSDMSCTNAGTGTAATTDTTGWDETLTISGINAPKTIVCTIDVDP
jgi:hypothetical protein